MVEVKTKSEVEADSDTAQNTSIVVLQEILEFECAEAISYEEAWELGESLLDFFEAFSAEGMNDTGTRTGS